MAQFTILPNVYILSPLTCFSKKRLFEEICATAAAISGLERNDLLRALEEREAQGSTVCAKGIAIPHALIPTLDKTVAILTILQQEVPYNSVDTDYQGVDMALAFFISPKDKYEDVEEMLRLVSKELSNTELANSIRRVWQENTKINMILRKLDELLSLEFKPAQEQAAPTNSLIQFINEAIG